MAPKSPWSKTATPSGNQANINQDAALPAINYGEVQSEELEALKAIYMDDYEAVETKSAWSKTTDRNFRLKLRAFSDEASFVQLSVRLTATYPKSPPLLEVTGLDAWLERTQKRIREIIKDRPKHLLGEVMIHAISSEIQDTLEDAVTARKLGVLPSLEDERASAEEVAAELARHTEETEARRLRIEQDEEQRTLKLMVDEELGRREKRRPAKPVPPSTDVDAAKTVSFDQASVQVGSELVAFDSVVLVAATRTGPDELWLGQPRMEHTIQPPLVAVRRLTINQKRQELVELETALDSARKLRHTNLVNLLAFRIERVDGSVSRLSLCTELTDHRTLYDTLELGDLHLSKAKTFTIGLLEALDFVHRHNMTHGAITSGRIYITNSTPATPKLTDLGYAGLTNNDSTVPAEWQPPEGRQDNAAARRRADIWDLAIVMMQMFLGIQVIGRIRSPLTLLGMVDHSDAFDDFIRKLFNSDAKRRPSAFDLLPCEFLRTESRIIGEKLQVNTRAKSARSSSGGAGSGDQLRRDSTTATEGSSRYVTDFSEIGRLGKGGFGEVVKARNKLDGSLYAIKKVKQTPQLLDQVLSEVMLLKRLNSPFVVRYFSTWLETETSGDEEAVSYTTTATADTGTDTTSSGLGMDFGYQSAGGLDFVSSTGYHIEFGNDDDDDSDDGDQGGKRDIEDDKLSPDPHLRLRKIHSDSRKSTLYIVMELCERSTLRDLIRRGIPSDDSWRYLRQITEGLSHIHHTGIIHRDLKPENVFIVAGNPKIGDFGLATTSQYTVDRQFAASGPSETGDMTRSVGTALYIAPELQSGSGGSYKVDMYSLGIMFFEMCEAFTTAMERIKALQSIREKDHELPPTFRPNAEKASQGKLVNWLISHKPSERPSSTELLRSDLLPLKIEDETIRQAIAGISDPRSPYHQKMMSALFAHDAASVSRVKDLAWDAKGPNVAEDADRLRLRGSARETLEAVFRKHGAEETRRETVFPRSGFYNANAVQVLDAAGNLLQLPYDLILPHARQLAKQTPSVKRTFAFGFAYRDAFTGSAPRINEEVDFDISSSDNEAAFDEAEVVKVMDEIVCGMPSLATSSVSFHVNHSLILDAILEHCRISTAQHAAVKDILSRLGFHKWSWPKVRTELRQFGLADTSLEDLQQFDFCESPEKAISKILSADMGPRVKSKRDAGIASLREMLHFASLFSIRHKICVAPLGSVNAKFYEGGILFQCVLERTSSRICIAAGGRFDSLILAHRTMATSTPCSGAVGISIGLDVILAQMAKPGSAGKGAFMKQQDTSEHISKRCDVLLLTGGTEGARKAGAKILASLWAGNISAEPAVDLRSVKDEAEYHCIVTVRHEASTSVRVRSTMSGAEETDIPITSLISHLKQEFRELDSSTKRPSTLGRHTSQQDGERKHGVYVLLAEHRSKKTNKYQIVESAQQRWLEKLEESKQAPILAVETRDDVIDAVRETRLSDAESWRRAVQAAMPSERRYVQQVQDILSTWRNLWSEGEGGREACVFNFRSGHCINYDLGS